MLDGLVSLGWRGGMGGAYSGHCVCCCWHQKARVVLETLLGSMAYWAMAEERKAEAAARKVMVYMLAVFAGSREIYEMAMYAVQDDGSAPAGDSEVRHGEPLTFNTIIRILVSVCFGSRQQEMPET